MTRNPTTREAASAPAAARVPFGTRTVRSVLGAAPVGLLDADRCTDPAVTALAQLVIAAAFRVDDLDEQITCDAARLARDIAALGDGDDAHLHVAWDTIVDRARHLAVDRLLLFTRTEALTAATRTYARATASNPRPAPPGTTVPHTAV